MTNKKKRQPKSTNKLSDDLRGLRSLRGSKQMVVMTTGALDRFIAKADLLEREVFGWVEEILSIGVSEEHNVSGDLKRAKEAAQRRKEIA